MACDESGKSAREDRKLAPFVHQRRRRKRRRRGNNGQKRKSSLIEILHKRERLVVNARAGEENRKERNERERGDQHPAWARAMPDILSAAGYESGNIKARCNLHTEKCREESDNEDGKSRVQMATGRELRLDRHENHHQKKRREKNAVAKASASESGRECEKRERFTGRFGTHIGDEQRNGRESPNNIKEAGLKVRCRTAHGRSEHKDDGGNCRSDARNAGSDGKYVLAVHRRTNEK